jgi:pteridine reductase
MNKKFRNSQGAALITGAAKRIGREMALKLAESGYDIVISYKKSASDAKKLSAEIEKKFRVKCETFCCDLEDVKQTKKLAAFMVKNFSNWNLLVNNASIFNQSKFLAAADSELVDNMNIHFVSPFILAREFAKNILTKKIKNAQIINMIDKNIMRFETSYFHYLLSKKFLAEFTKMLAIEIAPEVRVNGIAPGFILDPVHGNYSPDELKKTIKKIPLQAKGDVENICQALEFLLKNKFVSGQIIFVDGGASLNHAG